ncbi:MAG: GntR family transcriptional regulator [Gammaproteobacteria bacterium]|nr:GntR family transcriptional regulator [Gammaproteobacteria bacterium]
MLDPDSPVPLYRQLADELSAQISAGHLAAGDRIPSEHELVAHYRLGRPTVRQATEVLVRRRVLERRRGSGTYVSEAPPEVDLFSLGGTLASFERSGIRLQTRLLKRLRLREVPSDPDNPFAGRRVYTIERLGAVKRQPVLLERIYFSPDVFPGLLEASTDAGSLSQLVERRYRLRPRAGRQTFRVQPAQSDLAKTLKLAARTPLLLVKRTLDFPRAPAAIFAELYCHTDELVFAQDLGDIHYA